MAKIFVSYRRADAEMEAGRIADWLDRHYGEAEVFMDIDAIEPGEDFKAKINQTIASVDALVAVIGRSWLEVADEHGRRRIDDPNDVLRLEVASALRRGIRVVPVCVQDAPVPRVDDLPDDLKPLADRNALPLSSANWKPGMDRLIAALDSVVRPSARGTPRPWPLLAALAGAVLLLTGVAVRSTKHESLLHPRFGGVGNFHGSDALWRLAGIFSALPTAAIATVAVVGAVSASRRDAMLPRATGLLMAAGVQGLALYLGVIAQKTNHEPAFVLPILGAALVLASAWLSRTPLPPGQTLPARARVLAAVGGVAMLVGMTFHFNGGGTSHRYESAVLDGTHAERWDALLVVVLALAVALTPVAQRRQFAGGVLTGCGVAAAFLWLRFVVIPLVEIRSVATPTAAAYVGFAGACLVAYAGRAACQPSHAREAPRYAIAARP